MRSSMFFESLETLYKCHDYFNYLISEMKRSAIMGFKGIMIVPLTEDIEEYIKVLEYLGFDIEKYDKKIHIQWSNSCYPSYNTNSVNCSDILPAKLLELSKTFAEIRGFMTDFEKEAKITALVKGEKEYYKKIPGDMDIELLEDYLDIVYGGDHVTIDDDYHVFTYWGNLSDETRDDETQNNDEIDEEKGEN